MFTQLLSFILSPQYHHPHSVCFCHTLYFLCVCVFMWLISVLGGFLTPEGSEQWLDEGIEHQQKQKQELLRSDLRSGQSFSQIRFRFRAS